MTQYMLSVHHTPDDPMFDLTPEEIQPIFEATDAFNRKLQEEGLWVFGGGLHPVESATTVDNTGAEAVITDGPFAESKEWLGGFWVIEAPDLDAALALAAEASRACHGKVEVRPFQDEPTAA
jgi:hypothetical protein